ncbi:MAG: hypothetical protein HQL16_07215 [Candidatus Omnitrophica bacterium]|nr:hypothetical protein [Candidatus Omnitrophota bacterium]
MITGNEAMVSELRDVHAPVAIPGEWLWLWILLSIALLAGIMAGTFFFLKRKKPLPEQVFVKPPSALALAALAELESSGMISKGLVKEYYVALTSIVRTYIEARFEIRAPEMTTEEFLERARSSEKMTEAHKGFLRDFLNVSDMVKFARAIPQMEEMKSALLLARRFVEETKEPDVI